MITEAKLKIALKDMMKTKKLKDINVTALCRKCGIHRQTFYYHYTDIYDLIAAIFLNENLGFKKKPKDTKSVLRGFVDYVAKNFLFLRSTYNSAARDLTDDFIFGKLTTFLFELWTKDSKPTEDVDVLRNCARRFAHFISDEFEFCFKDPTLTPISFKNSMSRFIDLAVDVLEPAVLSFSKQELNR